MAPKDDAKTAPAAEPSKPSNDVKKKAAAISKTNGVDDGLLSKFRPRRRFVVFGTFLAICLGILLLHDPCDVKKKKTDCGYSGITPFACRTSACFTKGGGEMEKKKITLKRKKGAKFGLVSGSKKEDSTMFVKSIKEGAVEDHNAQADPEDRIYPRDTITSIDGAGGATMRKTLSSSTKESHVIEIKRSKLPSYLRWIHTSSKPNYLEVVLTAPGTLNWFNSFYKLAGLGFSLWYVSGYPVYSLPLYYWGVSGAMAWHMSRCCHDEKVPAGVPHCYRGGTAKLDVAINRIRTKAEDTYAKIKKDPRSYFYWLFWAPTSLDKWLQ